MQKPMISYHVACSNFTVFVASLFACFHTIGPESNKTTSLYAGCS